MRHETISECERSALPLPRLLLTLLTPVTFHLFRMSERSFLRPSPLRRYIVMHLTLLSAWRKWKYSELPPPSPRRTHDRSSSGWKTRQYQPCLQTPPSREVPDPVEDSGSADGEIPLLPAPILVGDHESSVGMESFEGGRRDPMIRNNCEEEKRGDKNHNDKRRKDKPIISADFSRSSVACDFRSSERRNAPSSPRTPPKLALRSPLDDDRGPLRAMDGPSRRRDKEKDLKLHVRDVGGSRCSAGLIGLVVDVPRDSPLYFSRRSKDNAF